MTVSYSGRSEQSGIGTQEPGEHRASRLTDDAVGFLRRPVWFGIPRPIALLVIAYVIAHAVFLAPALEDIDSINFALGLRHFDVANHQPHPPGYPVFIALGRLSRAVTHELAPSLDPARLDAIALASWSAICGGIALIAAWSIFVAIGAYRSTGGPRPLFKVGGISFWATALLAASPLFWMSGLRPLSDMTGLAIAMVAQAFAFKGVTDRRAVIIAALVAGIAAGVRVQTACLTIPVLVFALWRQREAGAYWLISRPIAALAAGALVWAIPLLAFSGGLSGYLHALGSQAGEDFAWTGMLWTNPTPRRLAFALWETCALPWDSLPLAVAIGVVSVTGGVIALVTDRRALIMLALAFAPYVVFQLLFQETVHVRYALPTLPLVAWLVVRGTIAARQAAPYVATALVAAALSVAAPAGAAYGREANPAFKAIDAMKSKAATSAPAAIYSHFSLRRPLQASAPDTLKIVEPRRSYEWMGLVDYWREGGSSPVWFLADARRTDLALIDPQSRTNVARFRWAAADRWTLSGARPVGVDWYVFDRPGWFASEGWALTPEVGGLSQAARTGVDHRPIDAFVRRRPGPMHVMVGGRHFSIAGDGPVVLSVAIDGSVVETWKVDPAPGGASFLHFFELPDGLPRGDGTYAHLTISARAEPAGKPTPPIAIRQFDIQPAGTMTYGFGEGWHEEEYETATGLRWRWTSKRSVLRIEPPQAVEIVLHGESPLKYFDSAPAVRIVAGDRVLSELHPEREFTWRVKVPADVAQRAAGAIAVEIDRVYLPGPAEGTSDTRQLGLRLFETTVIPAHPDTP
jgi:hypothetical protein